ncbi:hypothetical protein Q0M94_28600 (plasmid) [Deinococcus radiomollis]|uniref:hypothetical protein n=1 Tax=Deinococcus radiomollis TaxID=468916 RepID=UPI0038921469
MLKLALAALLLGAASAAPLPPTFCSVEARVSPDHTPGFYTVTVTVSPDCPANSEAQVHLESYIGGAYPHPEWFVVTRETPLIRSGIPWYWRLARRVTSGLVYHRAIPGMRPPF